jgi:hypothetical protein
MVDMAEQMLFDMGLEGAQVFFHTLADRVTTLARIRVPQRLRALVFDLQPTIQKALKSVHFDLVTLDPLIPRRRHNVSRVIGKGGPTLYTPPFASLTEFLPMKSLSRLLVALCLCPLLVEAAPLHQITLPDGRQVQLNDDFTWEYLLIKPAETSSGKVVTTSVAAPVLTDQALANPDLLSQATRDGITVKLDQMAGDDPLSLQFLVSNSGSRNVVRVNGSLTLFSAEGVQLSSQPVSGSGRTGCQSPICARGRHARPVPSSWPALPASPASRWCGCRSTRWNSADRVAGEAALPRRLLRR